MSSRDLEIQIQELLEGQLAAQATQELQQVLREDPQAQEIYREYVLLQHCLKFRGKGVDMINVVPMEKIMERRKRRAVRQALAAAAALMLLAVLALGLMMGEDPLMTYKASPGSNVVLSHHLSGDDQPQGQAMAEGSTLEIKRGSIEMDFANGVHGFIKGPALMTLVSEGRLELEKGTAWFEVPPDAVGFQVRTNQFTLTDLGTEFGVIAGRNNMDEAHVFEGRVELNNSKGEQVIEILEAGQARRALVDGSFETIETKAGKFLTKLPDSPPARPMVMASTSFTSSPDNQMRSIKSVTFSQQADLRDFNPQGADKLVVTLSHEHGVVEEVRYGGKALAPAVRTQGGQGQLTSIWYLDQPQGPANLDIRMKNKINGIGGCILALTKTAPGGPDDTMSGSGPLFRIQSGENSLVIAAIAINSSKANENPVVPPPLQALFSLPTGSNSGAAGYMWVRPDGKASASFKGSGRPSSTVAAAFASDQ